MATSPEPLLVYQVRGPGKEWVSAVPAAVCVFHPFPKHKAAAAGEKLWCSLVRGDALEPRVRRGSHLGRSMFTLTSIIAEAEEDEGARSLIATAAASAQTLRITAALSYQTAHL